MAALTRDALQGRNLQISVASGDALDVRQFSVEERVSSLFTVRVAAVSDNPALDFDAIVGQPARFTIQGSAHERSWSGICSHLEQIGVEEDGASTYQLTLVPDLWLATQRRNYRIFQQLSEPDIALTILREWGVEARLRLTAAYKKRKYRVQYAESDFAFLSRVLEDAGVSFYFAQEGGENRLVLSDAPHLSEPREKKIPFKDDASLQRGEGGEHVTRVRIAQQVRPGRYTMRDHDYRRPPAHQPSSSAEAASVDVERRLERYHYTPGAFLFGTDKGEGTPAADDRGKTRVDEAEAALLAQKRLEAKRSDAKVCTFETSALDLAPGVVLSFLDHPRPDLAPDQKLLVVASTLEGTSTGAWTHRCEARSAARPYRPPLSTPKPRALGAESATVVGPPGEEIHTDEFGRVRVHFHWDRESKLDDRSSCWIHVSQPWGGAGFGGVNLPRVGQEVLVEFLGGDPDRPVIVGRVFTNLQKVPYKLPENRTQSGWKSQSSPGGGGSNELRFEDAKGKEQVYLQAERDLKMLVKNDEDITVGGNLVKLVGNNEREMTGKSRNVVIGLNRATQVGAIDSTLVGDTYTVLVSPPGEGAPPRGTGLTISNSRIVLSTGKAKIILHDGKIVLSGRIIQLRSRRDTQIFARRNTLIASKHDAIIHSRHDTRIKSWRRTRLRSKKDMTIVSEEDLRIRVEGEASLTAEMNYITPAAEEMPEEGYEEGEEGYEDDEEGEDDYDDGEEGEDGEDDYDDGEDDYDDGEEDPGEEDPGEEDPGEEDPGEEDPGYEEDPGDEEPLEEEEEDPGNQGV